MERRPFGSTKREVAVIGQGTWYIEQAGIRDGGRRAAPRPRSRHDAYRHRGDVRLRRGRRAGRGGDRRPARRGLPRLQGAAAQRLRDAAPSPPASGRSSGSGPTGSTAIFCTGAVASAGGDGRGFERLRAAARSSPGASAISMSTTSTRFARSPGAGHPACNQVLYHLNERAIEHAVIPWCEAQRRRRGRL